MPLTFINMCSIVNSNITSTVIVYTITVNAKYPLESSMKNSRTSIYELGEDKKFKFPPNVEIIGSISNAVKTNKYSVLKGVIRSVNGGELRSFMTAMSKFLPGLATIKFLDPTIPGSK